MHLHKQLPKPKEISLPTLEDKVSILVHCLLKYKKKREQIYCSLFSRYELFLTNREVTFSVS